MRGQKGSLPFRAVRSCRDCRSLTGSLMMAPSMVQLPPVCYAHLPISRHVMSTSYASGSVQWAGHANFPSCETHTAGRGVIKPRTDSHHIVTQVHRPKCGVCTSASLQDLWLPAGFTHRIPMGAGRWRREEGGGLWLLWLLACFTPGWLHLLQKALLLSSPAPTSHQLHLRTSGQGR